MESTSNLNANPTPAEVDTTFFILCTIGTSISILASLGLVLSLKQKTSTYARLTRHIVMSECIFTFAQLLIVLGHRLSNYTKFVCSIFRPLLFNLISEDSCDIINLANRSLYHANEAFSIALNFFICLELILILKNPIAQMSSRSKSYFFAATFAGVATFFIVLVPSNNSDATSMDEIYDAFIPM
jgi:hypothetical protein